MNAHLLHCILPLLGAFFHKLNWGACARYSRFNMKLTVGQQHLPSGPSFAFVHQLGIRCVIFPDRRRALCWLCWASMIGALLRPVLQPYYRPAKYLRISSAWQFIHYGVACSDSWSTRTTTNKRAKLHVPRWHPFLIIAIIRQCRSVW